MHNIYITERLTYILTLANNICAVFVQNDLIFWVDWVPPSLWDRFVRTKDNTVKCTTVHLVLCFTDSFDLTRRYCSTMWQLSRRSSSQSWRPCRSTSARALGLTTATPSSSSRLPCTASCLTVRKSSRLTCSWLPDLFCCAVKNLKSKFCQFCFLFVWVFFF